MDGGTSVSKASGSAFSRSSPDAAVMRNLYRCPSTASGDDALPHPRRSARVEGHAARAPVAEVAGHADGSRRGGPDGEAHPAVDDVRAEPFVQAVVAALAEQVEIEVTESGVGHALLLAVGWSTMRRSPSRGRWTQSGRLPSS